MHYVDGINPCSQRMSLIPLPNDNISGWSKLTEFAEGAPNELKTLWEKEKLLVMSNISFSHSVFRRLVQQTRKTRAFFRKGLYNILSPFRFGVPDVS